MAHLNDIQTRFPTNDALSRVKESGCNEGKTTYFSFCATEIWQEIRLHLRVSLDETGGLQANIIGAHQSLRVSIALPISNFY